MKSPLIYNEIRVARSLVFCVVFCISLFAKAFHTLSYMFGIMVDSERLERERALKGY
jgi:hypothetical protein